MPYFKYMGEVAAKSYLQFSTVRFCPPNLYNDPFELSPEIRMINDTNLKQKELKFDLSGCHSSELGKYEIPEGEIKNYGRRLQADYLARLSEKVGTACFSYSGKRIPINILMWAHYAESHKGIALQLKDQSPVIESLSAVAYRSSRPVLDGETFLNEGVLKISDLFVKSSHWSYEQEFRLSKNLLECERLENGIFIGELAPENLERIVVGVNASEELKEIALSFHHSHHVQVIFTKCSETGFGFEPYTILGSDYASAIKISEWYRSETTLT